MLVPRNVFFFLWAFESNKVFYNSFRQTIIHSIPVVIICQQNDSYFFMGKKFDEASKARDTPGMINKLDNG